MRAKTNARGRSCPRGLQKLRSALRIRLVYALIILTASIYTVYVIGFISVHRAPSAILDGFLPDGAAHRRHDNTTQIILFWTSFFDHGDFYLGFGRRPFLGCPVSDCSTTNDRARLLDAEAVVFHARDLNGYDLPRVRRSGQRYLFLLYESPQHTWLNLKNYAHFFNWTMTYRFDSDIPPRVRLVKLGGVSKSIDSNSTTPGIGGGSTGQPIKNKKKLIAWIVSNCWTYNRRETYVSELRRYVPVDVFGSCGEQTDVCSRALSLEQCYSRIEREYKFYLSFENSNCRDYFTEKLTNVLAYDMVPVVYGGANYSAFLPPRAYIDVMDYASPRHLAEFLQQLDEDDDLYGEYLSWKRDYRMEVVTMPWCDLCAQLHDAGQPSKSYADIHGWWMDSGNCSDALRLPEMGRSAASQYASYVLDGVVFKLQIFGQNLKFLWQAL